MNNNVKKLVDKNNWILVNDLRKELERIVRDDSVLCTRDDFASVIVALDKVLTKKAEWPID